MVEIAYFVHSVTTDNEAHIGTGWLPGELSAEGVHRAKLVAGQLADRKYDVVFSSDLKRAVDITQIFFDTRFPVVQDKRLREVNYGDLNGKPSQPLDDAANYIDTSFPNGESYKDVEARMRSFCDFLKHNYEDKHIAIVAHRAPQLALDVILGGKTWAQAIATDWRKTKAWQPGWSYTIPG